MSEAPKRIFLRRVLNLDGSWTKRWQDLWRSDSGDTEYIRADVVDEQLVRAFEQGARASRDEMAGRRGPLDVPTEARRLLLAGTLGQPEGESDGE